MLSVLLVSHYTIQYRLLHGILVHHERHGCGVLEDVLVVSEGKFDRHIDAEHDLSLAGDVLADRRHDSLLHEVVEVFFLLELLDHCFLGRESKLLCCHCSVGVQIINNNQSYIYLLFQFFIAHGRQLHHKLFNILQLIY